MLGVYINYFMEQRLRYTLGLNLDANKEQICRRDAKWPRPLITQATSPSPVLSERVFHK